MTTSISTPEILHWIGGPVDGEPGARRGDVTDSATAERVGTVPFATAREVDGVVGAATAAAAELGAMSLAKRTELLFRFRGLVDTHRDELATLITREHGKVPGDAQGEIQRGLEVVEFACGLAQMLKGELSAQVSRGVDSYSLRQPLGVVAGITPFNFPVMVPMWMFPIAIAAGNAFILKPSEQDPSAAVKLAELFSEAGLPTGGLSVVHGDRETVTAILDHPGIAAVSFVGSTPVARYIYERGTAAGKRVQALGGAKNHAVVMPDADMDLAADGLISAGYGSTGQRCMAVSVAVTVGDAADPLIERLRARISRLVVGPGSDDSAEVGPLVSAAHRERVVSLIDAGQSEGADLLEDGRDVQVAGHPGGFFVGPCLFDNVSAEMAIYREEIFGPVLLVVRAGSYREAIELINSNPYGNGAAIFTSDGGVARMFEQEVTAGMVGINVSIPVPMAYHSFGGWKSSLFGDTHVHGLDGFRFYTRGKVVTRRWPDPGHRGIDLGFPSSGGDRV
jgi:malonate-semialdehyde dehydrogenase (acetylating)/methylmalonate-semialdehyde dehydrogenase